MQGQIQDLKKEGAQGVREFAPNIFLTNLGDFLKNLAQKRVGVRLLLPLSGSAPVMVRCEVVQSAFRNHTFIVVILSLDDDTESKICV